MRGSAVVELVAVAVASVLIGGAVGAVGARITLGRLPMFAGSPAVPVPQHVFVAWPWLLGLAGAMAVLFMIVAVLIARRIGAAGTSGRE